LLFEKLSRALGFSFIDNNCLFNSLDNGGSFEDFLDDSLFLDFVDDGFFNFLVSLVAVGLVYNRYVHFVNVSDMLFVDDRLDVVMDVLLNDHWLMVLMDHLLMVFVDDVLLMFYEHVLVVFVDDVLVDLLEDGLGDVGLDLDSEIMLLHGLSFVDFFALGLVLVLHHDGLFGDYFHDGCALVLVGSEIALGGSLNMCT